MRSIRYGVPSRARLLYLGFEVHRDILVRECHFTDLWTIGALRRMLHPTSCLHWRG